MIDALLALQVALVGGALAHAWIDLWLAPKLPREPPSRDAWPSITVLVPARDEELNIAACVDSLLSQDYPGLEVVVIDDGSTDRTVEIVRERAGATGRLTLSRCPPRPEGWQGKSWALHHGVGLARGAWLAMIDADVVLGPRALRRAMSVALASDVRLLSLLPALRDVTFWEKVIQPVFGLFIFMLQPLRLARDLGSSVVVANGQFLLVERGAYDASGGHAAVRGAIVEDVELARVFKRRGIPLLVTPAFEDMSVRMYRGLGGIWRGWGKTLHPYVLERPLGAWAGATLVLALFLTPFVLLPWQLAADPGAAAVAVEAALVGLILCNAALFRIVSRHEVLHAVFWPVALVVLFALVVTRTVAARRGRGVEWKGRRYP